MHPVFLLLVVIPMIGAIVGAVGAMMSLVALPVVYTAIMLFGLFKAPSFLPTGTGGIYLIWSGCAAWIAYGVVTITF